MIVVENVSQSFGKKCVLDDINLTIDKNEVCALVGKNGAGKSTFIQTLLGLLPLKRGRVLISGKEYTGKRRSNNKIAYLPEKFMLYPSLSGWENMKFFARAVSSQVNEGKMEELLSAVKLWDDRDKAIKNYSKGMLQRLGIAITLYQDSDILLLDEPTSGLDPIGRKEVIETLRSLKDKTILISSHHLDEIKQLCTSVAFLNERKITKYGVEEFMKTENLGVKVE